MAFRKSAALALLVSLAAIPALQVSATTWEYLGWPYRIPITVEELSGSDLTDFQVYLRVDYRPGMRDDFSDLRFTLYDPGPPESEVRLNYWVESYVPGSHADVWVKVPLIPASSSVTIYLYFGNPSASSESDIDGVMERGLCYKYYDGTYFNTLKATGVDSNLNHDWGSGRACINCANPDEDQSDTLSINWTGWVLPPSPGTYTFYTTNDDGVRLWVNGNLLIDDWSLHAPLERSGSTYLDGPARVNLIWFENYGLAVIKLGWEGPSIPKVYPIPSTYLRCKKLAPTEPRVTFGSVEAYVDGEFLYPTDGEVVHPPGIEIRFRITSGSSMVGRVSFEVEGDSVDGAHISPDLWGVSYPISVEHPEGNLTIKAVVYDPSDVKLLEKEVTVRVSIYEESPMVIVWAGPPSPGPGKVIATILNSTRHVVDPDGPPSVIITSLDGSLVASGAMTRSSEGVYSYDWEVAEGVYQVRVQAVVRGIPVDGVTVLAVGEEGWKELSDEMKENFRGISSSIGSLQSEIRSIGSQIRAQTLLIENLTELEDRIAQLRKMLNELDDSVSEVRAGVRSVGTDVRKGFDRVSRQVRVLDENLSRIRAELREVKASVLKFVEEYRNVSRMLKEANSRADRLMQEVMRLREDVNEVRKKLSEREVKVSLVDDPAGAPILEALNGKAEVRVRWLNLVEVFSGEVSEGKPVRLGWAVLPGPYYLEITASPKRSEVIWLSRLPFLASLLVVVSLLALALRDKVKR